MHSTKYELRGTLQNPMGDLFSVIFAVTLFSSQRSWWKCGTTGSISCRCTFSKPFQNSSANGRPIWNSHFFLNCSVFYIFVVGTCYGSKRGHSFLFGPLAHLVFGSTSLHFDVDMFNYSVLCCLYVSAYAAMFQEIGHEYTKPIRYWIE